MLPKRLVMKSERGRKSKSYRKGGGVNLIFTTHEFDKHFWSGQGSV